MRRATRWRSTARSAGPKACRSIARRCARRSPPTRVMPGSRSSRRSSRSPHTASRARTPRSSTRSRRRRKASARSRTRTAARCRSASNPRWSEKKPRSSRRAQRSHVALRSLRSLRFFPTMLPKEHGAYGQLLFPIVTALAVGRPGAVAWLLAAAAICAFFAHEPLLVLLGQRGARSAREQRRQASVWFGGCASAAALSGVSAIALASPDLRVALAVPAALAAILLLLILAHREHTTIGEVLSAIALSSIAVPIARASGALPAVALTCALVFASAFVAGTLCVRAVIAATRQPPSTWTRGVARLVAAGSLVLLQALAAGGTGSRTPPWAAAPVCLGGLILVLAVPSARHLRTIGWGLVAATTVTAVILIATLR